MENVTAIKEFQVKIVQYLKIWFVQIIVIILMDFVMENVPVISSEKENLVKFM